ncbi:testis-specific serine/threonine-protein kinase 4-like [Oppia nitens]|uniref:testis-specific serine/threonine-protein kinase 4-like n=1 Tax=Oppia nitens TaxID=1686743 RepID=UPI0023DC9E22|nr:testis-specific serine/threonine-protein kinase 4-like [Oppia nitens]
MSQLPNQIPESDRRVLNVRGYDVGQYLGGGAYGSVFVGQCNELAYKHSEVTPELVQRCMTEKKSTVFKEGTDGKLYYNESLSGKPCAIKMLLISQSQAHFMYNEGQLLKDLKHQNIIEIYGIVDTLNTMYIITELITGGTMENYIKQCRRTNQRISQWQVRDLFRQMMSGLQYMHCKRVVHRDISLWNIMLQIRDLNLPGQVVVKYIDFGSALNMDVYTAQVGTPRGHTIQGVTEYNDIRSLSAVFKAVLSVSDFADSQLKNRIQHIVTLMDYSFDPHYRLVEALSADLEPLFEQLPPEQPQLIGTTGQRSGSGTATN